MKFIVTVFLIILISFVACLYFPWWIIAIVSFIVSVLIPLKAGNSFTAGFLSLLILWTSLTLWISYENGNAFTQKLSLLIIKVNNPFFLIAITVLIGSIVGGFGALSGTYFRRLFSRPLADERKQVIV